jgi:transcription initiation factor TFIID subunit TAF12
LAETVSREAINKSTFHFGCQILLEIADGFIDDISRFAGELAKHRGSDVLTGRDVFVHLGMDFLSRSCPGEIRTTCQKYQQLRDTYLSILSYR